MARCRVKKLRYVHFSYDDAWQVSNLATPSGEEFLLYFVKASTPIRLEVTLGEFANVIAQVDNIIYSLNNCYRSIMMITGSSPDTFRDYKFDVLIPDIIQQMSDNLAELKAIVAHIQELTAEESGSSFTSSFNTLINDLELMTERPSVIAKKLESFKSNLGTISTWMVNATSQPVGFDWVQITPESEELPKANSNFFENVVHQAKMFASSFYMDYNNVGRTEASLQGTREVTVWWLPAKTNRRSFVV